MTYPVSKKVVKLNVTLDQHKRHNLREIIQSLLQKALFSKAPIGYVLRDKLADKTLEEIEGELTNER